MADKTYKNLFDDGYTTYHDDGTTSKTYKHLFDDGYTTYHNDGSKSDTYQHLFDDGYKTYHSDGSTSDTYHHLFDDGYVTYNSDGSRSDTYGNILDDGYTTYHSGGGSAHGGYGGAGIPYGGGGTPSGGYGYAGGSSAGRGYAHTGVANAGSSLFWISLLIFAANACFCFLPYMIRDGSFIGMAAFNHDQLFYQFSFMPRIITSLFAVGFLSYTSGKRWYMGSGTLGSCAAVVWSFIICFIATTARYTQASFNAANAYDAWKFFGITLVVFIAVIVICRKLGERRS